MDRWDSKRSVVSPLYFGYRAPHPDHDAIAGAFSLACDGIPPVNVIRKVFIPPRGQASVRHAREVHSVPGVEGVYARRARCVDRATSETLTAAINRWVWEVGYVVYAPGVLSPAIDPGLTAIMLEVSRFRATRGAVRAAGQLALFRALFTQGLRVFDPNLVVFGGQRDFDESLWAFAPEAVEAAEQ